MPYWSLTLSTPLAIPLLTGSETGPGDSAGTVTVSQSRPGRPRSNTLRYMSRSPDERVTDTLAREICQRENIKAVLGGSIVMVGSQYVVALNAANCATGESIAREQREAGSKETVLTELGRAATSLRARLGESLPSIEKFDAPIERATTPSLEALRAFTEGRRFNAAAAFDKAVPFLQRAVELDPSFAMESERLRRATPAGKCLQLARPLRRGLGRASRNAATQSGGWCARGSNPQSLIHAVQSLRGSQSARRRPSQCPQVLPGLSCDRKDADPDIPILVQAMREYAKLGSG